MFSKKYTILFIFLCIPLVLVFSLLYSKNSNQINFDEKDSANFAWVDYYKLREGRYWLSVSENGQVLFLNFGVPGTYEINEAKSGSVTPDEAAPIWGFLNELDFFNNESNNSLVDNGILHEGDILKIAAYHNNEYKIISKRPPKSMTPGLNKFIKEIEKLIPKLKPNYKKEIFITTEKIGGARYERLISNNNQFYLIKEQQLKSLPALKASIIFPGKFSSLDPNEYQKIQKYLSKNNYFFVTVLNNHYQIKLFSSKKGGSNNANE